MLYTVNLVAEGQSLTGPSFRVASDIIASAHVIFDVSDEWIGHNHLKAFFTSRAGVFGMVLNDFECDVPTEVFTSVGGVHVNLCAYDIVEDEVIERLTSFQTKIFDVVQKVAIDGDNSSNPTPEQWEQELTAEQTERINADTHLMDDIDAETVARTRADEALSNAIAGKLSDAPSDGKQYARKNGAWTEVAGGSTAWSDITGKPSTFTPSAHTHTKSEITDLSVPTKTSDLTNDGDGTNAFLTQHQDITGKQDKSSLESDVSAKGFTKNAGTVTSVAVQMNGAVKGTVTASGTIDLGTVITQHQSLSNYYTKSEVDTAISTAIGTAIGGAY